MMLPHDELSRLRKEARILRKEVATLRRSRDAHQEKSGSLEKTIVTQREKIKNLTGRVEALTKENQELKSRLGHEIDKAKTYAGMIFKSNVRKEPTGTGRRGVPGHRGNGRRNPDHIDRTVDVFLTHCNNCGDELKQTSSFDERIVEDIPVVSTIVTKYRIERQWCTGCHREVRGIPAGTIPGARFGVNTLALILSLKYRLRTPLEKIAEILQTQYDLSITPQGIQELLSLTKTKFTKQYNDILTEIRNAPMKHADETGWRINGVNSWCWLFATPTAAFYTIEETRGKEVPHRILGHDPTGVLVRDDCPSYFSLPMPQQSCWAHLLRVSHDATVKDGASLEMVALHRELSALFDELDASLQVSRHHKTNH
jgi:transposase